MDTRVNVLPLDASAHDTGAMARSTLGAAFLAYFAGTALLYFWGPWQFPANTGRSSLVVFLAAVHVAFAFGYVVGVRGTPVHARIGFGVERVVLVAGSLELLLLLPTSYYNTGYWLPRPWLAVEDLGFAYSQSLALREHGTPYVNYVRILLAPLLAATIPLGVFCWPHLGWVTRTVFALAATGSIVLFVAMGANAGAAQWLALFPWFVLASHLAGVHRLSSGAWAKAAILLLGSALVFGVFFAASMAQRAGSYAKSGSMDGIGAQLGRPAEMQDPAAPSRSALRIGADGLAAYLSQGYHAVYLSLQEPFVPCYGVGNSVFLQRQVTRLTGNTYFVECPYPVRIEPRGWRATVYWASIYPWIASDVTFAGTVIVMGLVGFLAGRVWLDCLVGNLLAVALLGQVLVLLYYVPAHNKVMHSGEGVAAFGVLLIAWIAARRQGR